MAETDAVQEVGILRILRRLSAAVATLICAGLVVLTGYGLIMKAQAESLLSDLTSLRVGLSGETEVQRLIQRLRRYVAGQHRDEHSLSTEFRIENRWLSVTRLEPRAWMSA